MPDLANITINKIMVHQLFKRADDGSLVIPKYGKTILTLSVEESSVMRERIVTALGSTSKSMDMDIVDDSDNGTISLMITLLDADKDLFVRRSQLVALRLAEAQTTRRISGCAVFIFTGTTGADNRRYVAIIKSESQSAFQLTEDTERGNIISLINDALLGKDHKLYKVAFIECLELAGSPTSCAVTVFDSNLDYAGTKKAAEYFYIDFLGCAIQENSRKLTKQFFEKTSEFIVSMGTTVERKRILQQSLVTYLYAAGQNTVHVNDFANSYFATAEERDEYSNFMRGQGFADRAVNKDISLLRKTLKKRVMVFSSGIVISGKSDVFDDSIKVIEECNDGYVVKISGRLEKQT